MSQSIRFLGVAVLAWAGVRAISLGLIPGTEALAFDLPAHTKTPPAAPVTPTMLPPIEPLAPPPARGPAAMSYGYNGAYPPGYGAPYGAYPPQPAYIPYPVYVPVQPAAYRQSAPVARRAYAEPMPEPVAGNPYFAPVSPLEEWQGIKLADASPVPESRATPAFSGNLALPGRLDRLSLSSWALIRSRPAPPGLATGGQLGGSQAGARLLWRFDPHLAASLRTSAPIGSQRGGEAALGIRYQPFASIPVAFTAERRQSLGRFGGRSAFAIFAEGGIYDRPTPFRSTLDAYLQTGIVGAKSRDWFVDGSAAVSRPVWRNISAGLGVWGGAQPGLTRLDIGPRVSMRVRQSMRVHFDYRYKALGNAQPGSGPAITLAGDF